MRRSSAPAGRLREWNRAGVSCLGTAPRSGCLGCQYRHSHLPAGCSARVDDEGLTGDLSGVVGYGIGGEAPGARNPETDPAAPPLPRIGEEREKARFLQRYPEAALSSLRASRRPPGPRPALRDSSFFILLTPFCLDRKIPVSPLHGGRFGQNTKPSCFLFGASRHPSVRSLIFPHDAGIYTYMSHGHFSVHPHADEVRGRASDATNS